MTFEKDKLTPENLYETRTSVKWSTTDNDVLPMFIAEMDFPLAPQIKEALINQVENSDLGYAVDLTDLANAFSSFATKRWGWTPRTDSFFPAPDVSFGVKAALRHFVPKGGRVALTTPVYPSFFGYLTELELEKEEIPLIQGENGLELDTDALERAFAAEGDEKVHALILSNPHNPHGIAHSQEILEKLAVAAAKHGTLIISDEIHAPLVHDASKFVPFAPIAEKFKTTAIIATSASKGWNIAGTKCALVYAPESITPGPLREYLNESLGYSASILGRTASTIAFAECSDWLDTAIARVKKNALDLVDLLQEHVPGAKYSPPESSYLAWIDLRDAGLGENPAETILEKARVLVSDGKTFGENGAGFIRLNLGCGEGLLREAIARIGAAIG